MDSALVMQLEGIGRSVEQIGDLRAGLEELRSLVGTLAQAVGTLAQTVEALLANSQQQKRSPDQQATPATNKASTDEAPRNQPVSADDETESEPSGYTGG